MRVPSAEARVGIRRFDRVDDRVQHDVGIITGYTVRQSTLYKNFSCRPPSFGARGPARIGDAGCCRNVDALEDRHANDE